ncbi:hydrogenase formation protein HypD [Alkalinema pantanalense CENA528]|uniref:hydrogenase formation protein HypD n=1 Tax=Alkalinema pantanalense TaxID=1620705 RepID=UPI003D6E2DC5
MKYINEYRNASTIQQYAQKIADITTQPWTIMEICGGQTHTIVKFGLDQLLPNALTIVHGPGCPVCVTSMETIEQALWLAAQPQVIFCSFGDMLRVPGHDRDLLSVKAQGGDVRTVYSPLDAVKIAQDNPDREVIFFAVGFETTAPATAMAVHLAQQQPLSNFSMLVAHVLVPPAMEQLLAAPHCQIQGFLAAGHVCTIMGYEEYDPIADRYHVPIVVTGFEPLDIMQGIYHCVQQLEAGTAQVENQYARSVQRTGNLTAQSAMQQVFEVCDRSWRGLGTIPNSGLRLKPSYANFDAVQRFALPPLSLSSNTLENLKENTEENPNSDCISGLILQGLQKPYQCSAFGTRCTPEHPLGAPMVSSEGACAAYYHYQSLTRSHPSTSR